MIVDSRLTDWYFVDHIFFNVKWRARDVAWRKLIDLLILTHTYDIFSVCRQSSLLFFFFWYRYDKRWHHIEVGEEDTAEDTEQTLPNGLTFRPDIAAIERIVGHGTTGASRGVRGPRYASYLLAKPQGSPSRPVSPARNLFPTES